MKNLTLINNIWKVRVDPNITEQEKSIIMNINVDQDIRKNTLNNIKNRSLEDPASEDIVIAQNIYDTNKLPNSILISADVFLPSGNGIINCRVDNEHKQIRF